MLHAKAEALKSSKLCSVCVTRTVKMALPSCGHVFCDECVSVETTRECPMCGQAVSAVCELYFP